MRKKLLGVNFQAYHTKTGNSRSVEWTTTPSTAALALRGSKVEDGDIALVDNGRDHYNALVPAVSS